MENIDVLLEYKKNLSILSSSWTPHDRQKQILRSLFNDKTPYTFIQAGRKFGKSEILLYIAFRIAMTKPNAAVYIIGPSRKQQGEILWENGKIKRFIKDMEYLGGVEFLDSTYRVRFPNGSFIKIDGSENYEAYRGTEYDAMLFDEFKDQDPRFYEAAYPNLAARKGILVVIGTPPDSENHYTDLAEIAVKDEDWLYAHGTSWDNPHIDEEWLKKEKKKYYDRGEGSVWEREFEARFVPGGAKAILPMLRRETHVRSRKAIELALKKDARHLQWFTLSDPGTNTCFCVLFIAYNPYTSQVYIVDEIYETNRMHTSTRKIWDRVKEKKQEWYSGEWRDGHDIAAAWFANEVMDFYGEAIEGVDKVSTDKDTQISLMKDMLLTPGVITISAECEQTYKEWSNYCTDEKGKYIKKNDHTVDAFRYFLTLCGYTLHIEDVEVIKEIDERRVVSVEDDWNEDAGDPFEMQWEDVGQWIM